MTKQLMKIGIQVRRHGCSSKGQALLWQLHGILHLQNVPDMCYCLTCSLTAVLHPWCYVICSTSAHHRAGAVCYWYVAGGRWRCLSRVGWRGALVLELFDSLDLPGRTAELARTFGIDFFSVLNRCGCGVSHASLCRVQQSCESLDAAGFQ
jgi:hypothetical protein